MSWTIGARWPEIAIVTLAAAVLALQCFIPPFIGIANNGDFSKVCMQFCLGPPDGWGDNFKFVATEYVQRKEYCWASQMRVSEYVVAWAALKLAALAGSPERLDIRWMGLLHGSLLLAATYLFVRFLRPLGGVAQGGLGLLAIWIFYDVRYVAYLNSFYMDTSAFLGLFLAVIMGVYAWRAPRTWTLLAYAAAVAFFAMSKGQHGTVGWMGAILPLILLRRVNGPRGPALAAAALIVAASAASIALVPRGYKGQALYNVVFYRILGSHPQPERIAGELGVAPDEVRYAGTYAFLKDSPGRKLVWVQQFYERTGFGRVLWFYLRHPGFVLGDLATDLRTATQYMRSPNVSNFRKVDGRPARALTARFGSWTRFRSWLFRVWPWHIVLWLGAFAVAGVWLILRQGLSTGYGWLLVLLSAAAAAEFGVAALADAVETDRHLFLFHAITDVTLVVSAAGAVTLIQRLRRFPQPSALAKAGEMAY